MPSRQFIKVTYSNKRRRIQNTSKGLLSSPLMTLPLEMDDLTRTQMAYRMLKRSRQVGVTTGDDATFQTPFCTSHLHESAITKPLMPELELSPVPAARRISSTSSRKLQENRSCPHSLRLASPFNSRPGSAASTRKFDQEDIPKTSVGKEWFEFPGTIPARGMALVSRSRRISSAPTPPASPSETYSPSSPGSHLAQDFGSLDICDGLDTRSVGETHCQSVPVSPLVRAHSLQEVSTKIRATPKKYAKRILTRKRAGTIRVSDYVQSGRGASSSGCAPGLIVSSLSNVRRTRSGTVVGPASKLAAIPGPDPESDDELLLKAAWIEDMVYLGLAMPADKGVEADELNLSGPSSRPPCRLGLRRR